MITLWVGIAALAQLINAGIVLVDKYVLASAGHIGKPVVYAFYVSILSGVVVVLLPFGVISLPSLPVIGLSLAASFTYILSILALYRALKYGNASDSVPIIGAVSAVCAAALAYALIANDLPLAFAPAVALLVVGTFLMSHLRFTLASLAFVIVSGIFFGASAVIIKLIFMEADFINGFFWSRMTNVAGALILLLPPGNREAIFAGYRGASSGLKWLVVSNKAMGGVAFALTLFAISIGSVSVVNAMSGLQFVFLLAFAYLGARSFPQIFRGEIHPHRFPHKLYGIACIVLGLAALFIA